MTNATSGGQTLANCVQYLDTTYQWGPVSTVDVTLAGETAHSVPIQIVSEPGDNFPDAPTACSDGGQASNTQELLLANGFIGISFYQQDCGTACAPGTTFNGGSYYACNTASSSCALTTVATAQQLQNPVGMFASDNNGVVLSLPNLPATGSSSVTGTLTFGIGTQSDNALGSAVVLTPDGSGNFSTKVNGVTTGVGFIDSGSNGLYFLNATDTGLPLCTDYVGFYCPTNPVSFTAANTGSNGATSTVPFSVANADTLLNIDNNGENSAFSNLGGTGDDTVDPAYGLYFDWGLPFFFNRSVFVAFEGQDAAGTTGPYWAY